MAELSNEKNINKSKRKWIDQHVLKIDYNDLTDYIMMNQVLWQENEKMKAIG